MDSSVMPYIICGYNSLKVESAKVLTCMRKCKCENVWYCESINMWKSKSVKVWKNLYATVWMCENTVYFNTFIPSHFNTFMQRVKVYFHTIHILTLWMKVLKYVCVKAWNRTNLKHLKVWKFGIMKTSQLCVPFIRHMSFHACLNIK